MEDREMLAMVVKYAKAYGFLDGIIQSIESIALSDKLTPQVALDRIRGILESTNESRCYFIESGL